MKIVLLTDSLGSGGAQRQLVGLAVFLKEKGYDVKVIAYYDFPFFKYILDEAEVENVVVEGGASRAKRVPAIRKSLINFRPDVVIAFQETPALVACIIKLFGAKWKLIVSERNTTQVNTWRTFFRFRLYKVSDYVVPNSYSQERFVRHYYPRLACKTFTISNFVDLAHFTPATVRTRNDCVQIVVAASIFSSKNTKGFIKALSYLIYRTQNFHVKWFGKVEAHQDYYEDCVALIESCGLVTYVELLDKTREIADRYREADVFCLPSFYEGTPNVICEAMACGLPVVCSDVCDNAIYVKEQVNGWLFDPTQPADMADKLYKAITATKELRLQYGEQSRKMAERCLSSEKFTGKWMDLLNSLTED